MPQYPKQVTMDHVGQAFKELQIKDKYNPASFYARVVNNRLEITLIGGRVLLWPPEPGPGPVRSRLRRKRREKD